MADSSFEKNRSEYYTVKGMPDGFTAGCIGRRINNIDYKGERTGIRNAEKRLLSEITGLHEKDILFLDQVHGRDVLLVAERPANPSYTCGTADAMITSLPGLCLVIRTADCVPVLVVDEKRRAIGAAHSGWKGTHLNISGSMVSLMEERYGCDPALMRAYILPSIGPESYEVNQDVAGFFPRQKIKRSDSLYIDLWAGIESSLNTAGIPAENIFNTEICNRKNTEEFFSHRFGDIGRNLNFIYYNP